MPAAPDPGRDPLGAVTTPAVGKVWLADRAVSLVALHRRPDRYTSLLSRARAETGFGVCLCRTDRVVRLVIRRHRSGRYHLATWPHGGHEHAPSCSWYGAAPSDHGRSESVEAIVAGEQGISVRLATPLTVRGPLSPTKPRGRPPDGDTHTITTTRRTAGLLALLRLLWTGARLHEWYPHAPRRTWSRCRDLVLEQADGCWVNGVPLSPHLWVVPEFRPDRAELTQVAWERFLLQRAGTGQVRHRGLVLGELRAREETAHGWRLRLAHQRSGLYATAALMERVARSYPSAFAATAHRRGRRPILLCLVERSHRGYPVVVDCAAMLAASYVPCDSNVEADMVEALIGAGRAFTKPVHFDSDTDQVLPDFILVDVEIPQYVEVWGRGDERYTARKRMKQALYRAAGRALLEWDVTDPLPDLARPAAVDQLERRPQR